MEKVVGELTYSIWVNCPYCGESTDLASIHDDEYVLAKCLFTNKEDVISWTNLQMEFECPRCANEFELDEIVY